MLVIGLVKHVGHLSGRDFTRQTGRHGSGGDTIDYVLDLRVCILQKHPLGGLRAPSWRGLLIDDQT